MDIEPTVFRVKVSETPTCGEGIEGDLHKVQNKGLTQRHRLKNCHGFFRWGGVWAAAEG